MPEETSSNCFRIKFETGNYFPKSKKYFSEEEKKKPDYKNADYNCTLGKLYGVY